MAKVELELREDILQNVRLSAEASHSTLEQWIENAIERSLTPSAPNALLGLFSDVPEMMDAVVEDAFSTREKHSLRQTYG